LIVVHTREVVNYGAATAPGNRFGKGKKHTESEHQERGNNGFWRGNKKGDPDELGLGYLSTLVEGCFGGLHPRQKLPWGVVTNRNSPGEPPHRGVHNQFRGNKGLLRHTLEEGGEGQRPSRKREIDPEAHISS